MPARPDSLQWVCDNDVARAVGDVTYTQALNERGGIEADFTVTRLAADTFLIVTGTAFGSARPGLAAPAGPARGDDAATSASPTSPAQLLLRAVGTALARDPAVG